MMTPRQMQLWQQIENFRLDDPDAGFKFSERLARENGWSPAYTHRVIAEYKKFIFLCCITTDGVTPSDAVDQAWHLHLTFTRSYWIDLCEHTLGQQIHHNPTKGGQAEAGRFDGYYSGTNLLYTQVFGKVPPADIWPDNKTRFSDINFRRVNTGRYWLLPKPRSITQVGVLLMLMVSVLLFVQASETIMAVGMMTVVIAIVIVAVYKSGGINDEDKNGTDSNGGASGCADGGSSHHGGHHGGDGGHGGGHGCSSGCSGCSSSGCSGCGGGGD